MQLLDELHEIDIVIIESVEQVVNIIEELKAPLVNPQHHSELLSCTRQFIDTIEQLRIRYDTLLRQLEEKDIKLDMNEVPILKPLNPIRIEE